MQNFNLLRELGKVRKPVLFETRHCGDPRRTACSRPNTCSRAETTKSFCASAAFAPLKLHTRNTMDISAIPIIHKAVPSSDDQQISRHPRRDKVAPMARASVAAGAMRSD